MKDWKTEVDVEPRVEDRCRTSPKTATTYSLLTYLLTCDGKAVQQTIVDVPNFVSRPDINELHVGRREVVDHCCVAPNQN